MTLYSPRSRQVTFDPTINNTVDVNMSALITSLQDLDDRVTDLEDRVNTRNIQAATLTTNSSGRVTWTYPIAYLANPVVSTDIRASTGQPYSIRTISESPTSITLDVFNSAAVTILGISVLSAFALVGAGVSVHVIAMKSS